MNADSSTQAGDGYARVPGHRTFGRARLRILLAVIAGFGRGEIPSTRELAALAGVNQPRAFHHLRQLRKAGLLTWDDKKGRTVRPLCRFVPASEIP